MGNSQASAKLEETNPSLKQIRVLMVDTEVKGLSRTFRTIILKFKDDGVNK